MRTCQNSMIKTNLHDRTSNCGQRISFIHNRKNYKVKDCRTLTDSLYCAVYSYHNSHSMKDLQYLSCSYYKIFINKHVASIKYAVEKGTDICKDHCHYHHTKMIRMYTVIRVRTKNFFQLRLVVSSELDLGVITLYR
jgi:hypothetical protein